MAKGIPLMGRDPDGKAKMINVDENGNVKVLQSGTIVEEEILVSGPPFVDFPAGASWNIPGRKLLGIDRIRVFFRATFIGKFSVEYGYQETHGSPDTTGWKSVPIGSAETQSFMVEIPVGPEYTYYRINNIGTNGGQIRRIVEWRYPYV